MLCTSSLCAVGAAIFLALPLQQGSSTKKSTGFILEAGEHELASVIDSAAKFLGRNLIYDATELGAMRSGPIVLQKRIQMDVRGCEELLSQLAWSRGVLMTPLDRERDLWEFVAVSGRRRNMARERSVLMTADEVLRRPRLKILVTTTLLLEHLDASRAANYLRPHWSSRTMPATMSPVGLHGIVLTAFRDDAARIIQTLRTLDRKENRSPDPRLQQRLPSVERRLAKVEKQLAKLTGSKRK